MTEAVSETPRQLSAGISLLYPVELFPTPARRAFAPLEKTVRDLVADDLLPHRIEPEAAIQTLRDATETEDLAERTRHRNRRARLLLALHGQQEVREVVGPDLGILRDRIVRSAADDG